MDAQMIEEFRSTLREVISSNADETSSALEELGWQDAVAEEPGQVTQLFFEEQGQAGGSSYFLDEQLAVLADLEVNGPIRFALPISREKWILRSGSARSAAIVVVTDMGVQHRDVSTLQLQAVNGLDPEAELVLVQTAQCVPRDDKGATVIALARRCLAAELVGVGRAALALGIEHVTARTQFGRPIGSFQAVRHRLAEVHADLTGAATLVEVAFQEADPASAMVAKAAAGRAADKAVRSVMQVSGAIGLTEEYSLHRHVRRAAVLDQLAGDSPRLERNLGRILLERSA